MTAVVVRQITWFIRKPTIAMMTATVSISKSKMRLDIAEYRISTTVISDASINKFAAKYPRYGEKICM